MTMPISRFWLVLLLVLFVGCGDGDRPQVVGDSGESPDAKAEDEHDHDHSHDKPKEGFPYKLDLSAKDVTGGWILYVNESHQEFISMLSEIQKRPGENGPTYAIAMQIPPGQDQVPLKITNSNTTETKVDVTFGSETLQLNFQGELSEGIVYGNIVFPEAVQLARLVRPGEPLTEAPQPHVVEGAQELSEIFTSGSDWDKLIAYIEKHPKSPLLPNVFYSLVNAVASKNLPEEDVLKLLDLADEKLSLWGPRFAALTRVNLNGMLADSYQHPKLVAAELAKLKEAKHDEKIAERVTAAITRIEAANAISLKMQSLGTAPSDQRMAILTELRESEGERTFDGLYLYQMGKLLEQAELPEEALKYYGRLVSLPMLEQGLMIRNAQRNITDVKPREDFNRVWEAVHGSQEGIEAYRLQTYRDFLQEVAGKVQLKEINSSSQTALVELYTGTQCPPCAAADMAFSILKDHYAGKPVSFLQYHVHVPGPDPMTNEDADALFYRSRAPGTPAVFVNRRPVGGIAGGPMQAALAVEMLQAEIENDRQQSHPMQVVLSAETPGSDTVVCRGEVRSESPTSERWRLHLVLAEREIMYRGSNGIPIHEMVVRQVLGPREGTAPSGKTLTLEKKVDLKQLRESLTSQMQKFETEHKFKFDAIPMDLKELVLVGFVTDERTERVLQSATLVIGDSAKSE